MEDQDRIGEARRSSIGKLCRPRANTGQGDKGQANKSPGYMRFPLAKGDHTFEPVRRLGFPSSIDWGLFW